MQLDYAGGAQQHAPLHLNTDKTTTISTGITPRAQRPEAIALTREELRRFVLDVMG